MNVYQVLDYVLFVLVLINIALLHTRVKRLEQSRNPTPPAQETL